MTNVDAMYAKSSRSMWNGALRDITCCVKRMVFLRFLLRDLVELSLFDIPIM